MTWSFEPKVLRNEFVEITTMLPADLPLVCAAMIPDPDGWYSVMFGLNHEAAYENEFDFSDHSRQLRSGMGFVIRNLKTSEVAGISFFLKMDSENRSLEIGTTNLAPKFRGTYVNAASKLAMLTEAFEKLGCIRVAFRVDEENLISRRAVEKLGAVDGGLLRSERILPDGRIRNYRFYSVIQEEWPSCKAKLLRRLPQSLHLR